MLEIIVELGVKAGVVAGLAISSLDRENQRHQGLGDKAPAIDAEMAAFVRTATEGIRNLHQSHLARRKMHDGDMESTKKSWRFRVLGRRRGRRGFCRYPFARGGSRRRRKHRPLPHRKYGPPRAAPRRSSRRTASMGGATTDPRSAPSRKPDRCPPAEHPAGAAAWRRTAADP